MVSFENKSFKEIFFDTTVTYSGGVIFVVLGLWCFFRVLKKENPKELSIISQYYDGISISISIFCLGVGILIYKIFIQK